MCARYQFLNKSLAAAAQRAHQTDTPLEKSKDFTETLYRMRAHREECQECIDELKAAFPELKGQNLIMQSLLTEE
jgi:hypothetical protein